MDSNSEVTERITSETPESVGQNVRPPRLGFTLLSVDGSSDARRGVLHTARGDVQTPVFMPVGTLASVKAMTNEMLRATGASMILGNTYHLAVRPGADLVAKFGGLHSFMGWDGPILTDSGGFQIFSLAQSVVIRESGATFRSHIDGTKFELTPERAMEIQSQLGSDVAMQLDHVVALPNKREKIQLAMERSVRWAERCKNAHNRDSQMLFAIVQGGLDHELRQTSAQMLRELDLPGYAIGGLSVGESPAEMYQILDVTTPLLPADKPRYLMGVGRPEDLLEGIARGVDMFDCVMPTRNGRNGHAFTDAGAVRIKNQVYREDPRPIEAGCPCPACQHSRAYVRHLFMCDEMLGPILLSAHNLTYYQRLMERARVAIEQSQFADFHARMRLGWETSKREPSDETSEPLA